MAIEWLLPSLKLPRCVQLKLLLLCQKQVDIDLSDKSVFPDLAATSRSVYSDNHRQDKKYVICLDLLLFFADSSVLT